MHTVGDGLRGFPDTPKLCKRTAYEGAMPGGKLKHAGAASLS